MVIDWFDSILVLYLQLRYLPMISFRPETRAIFIVKIAYQSRVTMEVPVCVF